MCSSDLVYHVYAIQTANRAALAAHLTAQEIQFGIHYPIPIHLQPAYADLGYHAGYFPIAEAVAGRVLSLPMFAEMTDAQVETVAAAVRSATGAAQPVGAPGRP